MTTFTVIVILEQSDGATHNVVVTVKALGPDQAVELATSAALNANPGQPWTVCDFWIADQLISLEGGLVS
mgnify:CR=1 FL=1